MKKTDEVASLAERPAPEKPDKTELSATEAYKNFGEFGYRAARGETVVVTRYGRPIFQISPVRPEGRE